MTSSILSPLLLSAKENARFWSKIDVCDPDDCWEWQAAKTKAGYGQFALKGRMKYAHRIAWVIVAGPIPEGMCVCHHCDNPSCVNFAHLFLGTHGDNAWDKVKKGRAAQKLVAEQVLEIRERVLGGERLMALAREYGVSMGEIGFIARGEHWKQVPMPDNMPKGNGGERSPFSKLTEKDVREIRRRVASGETHTSLAKAFGVRRSTISHIARGDSWGHLPVLANIPRGRAGAQIGTAKLTDEFVREIRQRAADGEMNISLAKAFGVSPSTIGRIVKRRAWKHIE